MRQYYLEQYALGYIRELLMHMNEFDELAWNFNLSDEQLLRVMLAAL